MILGHGQAHTEEALIADYHRLLWDCHPASSQTIQTRLLSAPMMMKGNIGKPIFQWTDVDIIDLYASRRKFTRYAYSTFLAFLFFRGYRRATLFLLTSLQLPLARHFRPALLSLRQRLQEAERELHYTPTGKTSVLNLLLYLLAVSGKSVEELTRADFDAFAKGYQAWYRGAKKRRNGRPDPYIFRLERYLIHWNIIPAAKKVLQHEVHFAFLRSEPIRNAILTHLQWCAAKYKPSTIFTRRAALLTFFLWFQEEYPDSSALNEVTRSVSLSYLRYLKDKVKDGTYCLNYSRDQQRCVRLFYDFVIDERLDTSPDRNPFSSRDLPRHTEPVPRYLSDAEVRSVLAYCHNGASLKERTIVMTLLHTGIRAAELAALKVTNIVQIQGTWKLHIQEGKGLKDRLIPLTPQCLHALQTWQWQGWEKVNDCLFTHHGHPWAGGARVCTVIRELGLKIGLKGLTPHRFRHTFAVALLNYGMRESALQKLMGHTTLGMTLEYARILDKTVEQAFHTAVEKMQTGPISWVPDFLQADEYATLTDAGAINWIRLPHGYCRRHPKLHCESDVKCLLCDRFCASSQDLPQLQEMHERFLQLGMQLKADAVYAHIVRLHSGIASNETLRIVNAEEELCPVCP